MRTFDEARRYTLYGDLSDRATAMLAAVLVAKGRAPQFVEESPSLSLVLAARGGSDLGPWLRTPEGFVLAGGHAILEWLEVTHPIPALLPTTPVRRACARMLEDWIDLWLPHWPRRSWGTLERVARHVDAVGFLLGAEPTRADWMLATWLETEVLVHDHAREHLSRHAPRLVRYGDDLLDALAAEPPSDDVLPITLLDLLAEIGRDYHTYLEKNHLACKDREREVVVDLGLGRIALPALAEAERRRVLIGRELRALDRDVRRRVSAVLEPVGAWQVLLPPRRSRSPIPRIRGASSARARPTRRR